MALIEDDDLVKTLPSAPRSPKICPQMSAPSSLRSRTRYGLNIALPPRRANAAGVAAK
jgi:hypothetical protein